MSIDGPEPVLPAPFAERVAANVRRRGHPFVAVDDVQEVVGGGRLIDTVAYKAIVDELREYGIACLDE
jgi:hypothetical protein